MAVDSLCWAARVAGDARHVAQDLLACQDAMLKATKFHISLCEVVSKPCRVLSNAFFKCAHESN